ERKRTSNNIGGWMLTSNGIEWVEGNKTRIEDYLGRKVPTGDRLPSDRKMKALKESVAFRKFTVYGEKANISHAEFAESIVCTVNTKPEVLNDRLEQLYSIAKKQRAEEVIGYINFSRERFASLLGG
ncbi:MAG: hypothetical protein ABID54_14865, partial [Pseudomonadota bacterium]